MTTKILLRYTCQWIFCTAIIMLSTSSQAQYNPFYGFGFTGAVDGVEPYGSVVSDGTYLYGMTKSGGSLNRGTLFKVLPDGSGYTKLIDFAGATNGSYPSGDLVYDGTYLYGMTPTGGANNEGVIFRIMPNGTNFTKLLDFAGTIHGSFPNGSLFFDGTFLYGMTAAGGANNRGVIFKIQTNGTGFAKLLDFTGLNGASPQGSLTSDGIFLYGMTQLGGINTVGTIFKIMPDGTAYTKLLDFTGAAGPSNIGSAPWGSLLYDGTRLFGMTLNGGANGFGVLFKINTDGTSYTKLKDFDTTSGLGPYGCVSLVGGMLFGLTSSGGVNSYGTIFSVAPDGTGFTKVWDFTAASGANPMSSLFFDGTHLFGMTRAGAMGGVIFKFLPAASGTTITVTTQPSNQFPCEGTTTSLTTAATGTTNLLYQWQKFNGTSFIDIANGSGYSNVTTSVLSINTTTNGVAGTYRCKISGDAASDVFTNPAIITVTPLPAAPVTVNASGCNLSSVVLTASGGVNGQYRWYTIPSGGVAISGEVNNQYSTPLLLTTTTYYVSVATGGCESVRSAVTATVITCNQNSPPVILSTSTTVRLDEAVTINLLSLVSDPDNNLNPASLAIIQSPLSGATAFINTSGLLTIDYNGISFSGEDRLTIQACDLSLSCTAQEIIINVAGDIMIYNAVSPNGDGKNDFLFIQHIDLIESTRRNHLTIFNRWGDVVFETRNYDNKEQRFRGVSNDQKELVTGTYYYKLTFDSSRLTLTGFLYLKR